MFAAYLHSVERARDRRAAPGQEDRRSSTPTPRSCTSSSTATPTARRPVRFTDDRRRPGARRRRADRVRARPADHRRPRRCTASSSRARSSAPTTTWRPKAAAAAEGEEDGPRQQGAGRPGDGRQARARRAAARARRPGARRQPRPRPRADPQPRRPSTPPTSTSRGSSSTRCSAPTTTAPRTPRPASGSPASPPAASGSSSTSCARDVTKTRKDGSRGRLRIDYGDHRDPQAALAWLWKYIDGAKTAGELYGRALVVIAAEQHATRLVVPSSQRTPATRWSSHKDHRRQGAAKLAGPHVPASLTRLEQAVKRAHARLRQGRDRGARAAGRRAPAGRRRDDDVRRRARRGPRRGRIASAARWRADAPPDGGTP